MTTNEFFLVRDSNFDIGCIPQMLLLCTKNT